MRQCYIKSLIKELLSFLFCQHVHAWYVIHVSVGTDTVIFHYAPFTYSRGNITNSYSLDTDECGIDKEIYLPDFSIILKQRLQNYWKYLKSYVVMFFLYSNILSHYSLLPVRTDYCDNVHTVITRLPLLVYGRYFFQLKLYE